MKHFPITKPLKVANFSQLINDLEHILLSHPGKDILLRSLRRIHKSSSKLKMVESLTQGCLIYFSSLEPNVLKLTLKRIEACVAGSIEGVLLSEVGLNITKESVRTIALVNGSGKESCLIYLWKEGQLLLSKLKARNNLYVEIKSYLDLSFSIKKSLKLVEAECEWHLIQISKWMQEIHEMKKLGQWVSCDVLMNQLNDKWEEIARLWLLKVKGSKISSKTRLSFLRSLLQRFPQCRLSAEKSGVQNIMLS